MFVQWFWYIFLLVSSTFSGAVLIKSLVILHWYSATLEAQVPLKTLHLADCFIVCFNNFSCQFPEFDTEFNTWSLLKFEAHPEITKDHRNMVSKILVILVQMFTAWHHMAMMMSNYYCLLLGVHTWLFYI